MGGGEVTVLAGIGGIPHYDCELGADIPVGWGVWAGDCFDVGGCAFFLVVAPGKE